MKMELTMQKADWQIVQIWPGFVVEVNCNGGGYRRVYPDGRSLDVIEQARREIDQRAWTHEGGNDLTAHLHAARQYLTGYLRALEQFGLVSVAIFNQLQATMEHELEKVQDEDEQ